MTSTPYETDYNQWIQETVQQLRNRNFHDIDWDNLIEAEIPLSQALDEDWFPIE